MKVKIKTKERLKVRRREERESVIHHCSETHYAFHHSFSFPGPKQVQGHATPLFTVADKIDGSSDGKATRGVPVRKK